MPTRSPLRALAAALSLSALCLPAQARMLCTVVADVADGRIVFQDGTQDACAARYTPASTFKLAIALMGYDAGILQDAHAPVWDYQPSYPDWGGDDWRKPVDPTHWIKYSVFWYSQQIGENWAWRACSNTRPRLATATRMCRATRARTMARRAPGTYRRCGSRRWNNSISCAGWQAATAGQAAGL